MRRWSQNRDEVRRFLALGRYREIELPVYDSLTNNIPSLSPRTPGGLQHRFATRHPGSDDEAFSIFVREELGVQRRR